MSIKLQNLNFKHIAIIFIILFFVLLILFPDILYDRFIWKYFVGPLEADAVGHPVERNGIIAREGYTIVSEIFYGLIMIIFIYLLYLFFEKYKIKVDLKFILFSIPFILYGSVARVIEDANILSPPVSFFFISPLIYVQVGIIFFLSLIYGLYKSNFIYLLIPFNAFFIIIFIFIISPLYLLILFLSSLFSYYTYKKYYNVIFSSGIFFLLVSLYILLSNLSPEHYEILIPLFLSFLVFPFYFFGIDKINITVVFSHMLDAFTTYFAVVNPLNFDFYYAEKHPLPEFLMKNFYGIGYPILKLLVVIGILYAINDIKINLRNTIKFFMLFLGLSPAIRDLLRILFGV